MFFGKSTHKGGMLITVLVFTTIFAMTGMVLASLVNSQFRYSARKVAWNRALQIAEAGANYYRWHLAHSPSDYYDGNDQASSPGPYIHDYSDPQGSTIGQFSLMITPPSACSNTVIIESTGYTSKFPTIKRKITVTYGRPSLAEFAFLTNSNVWFGDTEELHGPVHSNGGIRQDGTNDSMVTSAKESYICGDEHNCNDEEKPGVWTSGTGGDQSLWTFPVSNVDFDSITADLSTLKSLAEAASCSATEDCYFHQHGLGYHVVFKSDGTFDLYQVKQKQNPVRSYDGESWIRESNDIKSQEFIDNYTLPSECAIIFIEDDVWVDGVVNGRVTLVAAKLPDVPNNNPKIIINDDITYLAKNGNHVLGLIGQKDIIIPLYGYPQQSSTLENLEINAVLLAQKGHCIRYYYDSPSPYYMNDTLTLYGVTITNTVWTWSWVNGSGQVISGYPNTVTIYDPNLTYNPPPGFPTTGEYQYLTWEETTEK